MPEVIEWIDPDGGTTVLEVEWATRGRGLPPVVLRDEEVPGHPGTVLREVEHGPRELVLPVWLSATGEAELRERIRDLARAMDPRRGEGRLRVTGPAGDQRELRCRVTAGLELDEVLGDTAGSTVQRVPLVLRATDPYWYATSDTVTPDFEAGQAAGWFPFFPLRLASSEVFADRTVDNVGDVDAWPVWTVTGPGAGLALRNLTTGLALELDYSLGAGETVTIDTRLGVKSVTRGDGLNLFEHLSTTSALWPLAPGPNAIRVELNAVGPSSRVRLAWRPRYLTV